MALIGEGIDHLETSSNSAGVMDMLALQGLCCYCARFGDAEHWRARITGKKYVNKIPIKLSLC